MMVEGGELFRESTTSPINNVEKIIERDGGLIEAFVPIELIDQEEVAVDSDHVAELAHSIQKESAKQNNTGQLTPVLLAEVPDTPKFVILDGFHRVPAMASLGKEQIYATIKPNTNWEEVVDLRIVAAKSHKSVKFSRIIEWVEQAWRHTDWSAKLNASAAFSLEYRNGSGMYSGIDQAEVVNIKNWVRQKCDQWGVSAQVIEKYLRTAQLASPDLVKEARERRDGRKLEAVTPMHLSGIVKFLPHRHDLQRLVANVATEQTLTVAHTTALALAISREVDAEKIQKLIDSRVWDRMEKTSVKVASKKYPEIALNSGESYNHVLMEKFFDDQI